MIDQATIDRITDAARIEEVVSDYVTLKKRGVNLIGLCPFHNEKTPSFIVSPAKGICKCFGCGKGGNSVHFIMEHEQISYYEALKFLAKKYHIEVEERELTPEETAAQNDRESMFRVNEYAQKYFSDTLHHHIDGKAVGLAYFRERGFRDDIIQKFQLGYSLEQRDAFTQAAIKAGYKQEYLIKTGLTLTPIDSPSKGELGDSANGAITANSQFTKSPPEGDLGSRGLRALDRFRGRVMFPVHSLSGKVVAFGGRILKKDDKMAKYINSPESEIYHKSNELYGIYFAKQAIVRHDRCYLVEGYTDVISMHQSGIENVVASSGTSLTPGQIRLIHRFTSNVTVIYDGDEAGIKASIRGIDLLLEEGLNIKVLLLPDGDDPDSFARKHNASDFIEFVEQKSLDFIRFKTNLLLKDAGKDPVKRAGLISDIVRSIAIIPNPIIRSEYVKECGSLLHVEEAILYHEINKLKQNEREKSIVREKTQKDAVADTGDSQLLAPGVAASAVFEQEERNILEALIRYGEKTLYYADSEMGKNEEPVTVGDFILEELERDGLEFSHPVHYGIFEQYKENYRNGNFAAERFFINHPNEKISLLAADLLTEKYTLSKIHTKIKKLPSDSERLIELIPRLVFEFKNSYILSLVREKLLEMKTSSEAGNAGRVNEIMQEIGRLNRIQQKLSKTLGERIIIKI
ncbi:MAG: toprim domain-containing protein [Prevotellaceae bacterium]|jgi:DNA primase|nr:toprim domain-containing protein [Prevotellaceae bacterium]